MSSLINQTKWGDCSRCPATDTNVVKVGKDLLCLQCNKELKFEKQLAKSKERNKFRGLMKSQVQEGNFDAADRQVLMNELDFVFSRILRFRETDKYSNCQCYTCPTRKHWSLMQCGHYVKRGNTEIRWNFKNAKVQCKYCNENLGGNLKVYAERLEKEEPGLPEQLTETGRQVYQWSREELKGLLIDLREKLRIAEQSFKERIIKL